MKILKTIGVFVLGLLAALIVLEISLRVLGHFQRVGEESDELVLDDADYRVLCIGDSFTAGLGASSEMSYPVQLQRQLNQNASKRYAVYKRGMSGANSTQILNQIGGYINTTKPDLIVLMMGGANDWNRYGDIELDPELKAVNNWLYRLRVYKLYRLVVERLEKRGEISELGENSDQTGEFYFQQGKYIKSFEWYKKMIQENPGKPKYYQGIIRPLEAMGDYENGLHYMMEANNKWPNAIQFPTAIIRQNLIYGQYDRALPWLRNGIRRFQGEPIFFYYYYIYNQNKQLNLQEELDSLKKMYPQKAAKAWQAYKNDDYFQEITGNVNNEAMYKEFEKHENKMIAWMREDIETAIKYIQKKEIGLILMTYPIYPIPSYAQALKRRNQAVRDLAKKYNLPLVDLEKRFEALGPSKPGYFQPLGVGDHPNARGYGYFASSIAEVVKMNQLIGFGSKKAKKSAN